MKIRLIRNIRHNFVTYKSAGIISDGFVDERTNKMWAECLKIRPLENHEWELVVTDEDIHEFIDGESHEENQ